MFFVIPHMNEDQLMHIKFIYSHSYWIMLLMANIICLVMFLCHNELIPPGGHIHITYILLIQLAHYSRLYGHYQHTIMVGNNVWLSTDSSGLGGSTNRGEIHMFINIPHTITLFFMNLKVFGRVRSLFFFCIINPSILLGISDLATCLIL